MNIVNARRRREAGLRMTYPPDMDVECVAICDTLNGLPGVRTEESCCGHGKQPHRIFFSAETIDSLSPILRAAHSSAWKVEACWASGSDGVYFMLEGPVGPANMPGGATDFVSWLINQFANTGQPA